MLSRSTQGVSGARISNAVVSEMETKRLVTQPSLSEPRPIEFLTENGFSIVRLCEIDKSISAVGTTHHFLVRDPHGYELHIIVEISQNAVEQIAASCRGRISNDSSYWICFAERRLATYLWDHDDYPPDATLNINQSTIDDLDLARRWGRQA
jgi:hypothetical protein